MPPVPVLTAVIAVCAAVMFVFAVEMSLASFERLDPAWSSLASIRASRFLWSLMTRATCSLGSLGKVVMAAP